MTVHLGPMPLTNSASRGTQFLPRQSNSREMTKPAIASWLPFPCPECSQQLALATTITGEFDFDNFVIRCTNPCWPIEFSLEEIAKLYPEVVLHLPDGHDPSTIFNKGLKTPCSSVKVSAQTNQAKLVANNSDLQSTRRTTGSGIRRNFTAKLNATSCTT